MVPGGPPRSHDRSRVRAVLFEIAWLLLAVIAGISLIGSSSNTPPGAAYFGISNAVAVGTTALGFIVIAAAVLGLALGLRRLSTKPGPGK